MERIKLKQIGVFVVLLLLAAATTVGAQTVDQLAEKGAAIANKDPVVAAARTAEPDIFYWKGFDVATGIFGDPALGALGNTAIGPGSLKFRNSLNAAGQRGFDASVTFHLGRDYKRKPGGVTALKKQPATDTDPHEIRCRGSAYPDANAIGFEIVGSRLTSTGETINLIELVALPGPYAAGPRGEGLRPAECSWVDRPITGTSLEQTLFRLRFETPANAQLKQQLHGTPVDTSPTAAERFPDTQTIPAYLNDSKHYWSFFGVRQVNNSYAADGYKYWKPPLKLAPPEVSIQLQNDNPYVTEKPIDVNALAARGGAIANQDPLAAELRNREPEGTGRRGFDIGMAAAEGQISEGPGKQRIHDSLSPAEQEGFDTAVAFSLERNRNADLAAKGAAIAKTDPVVAAARAVETDVFYWLGFDIATGIFGDPALGARGNTATGPGSLKIRDSLSAAGQRGFNDAAKLHLSRNYKP